MDSSLLDLLRKTHTPDPNKFTHLTLYGPVSKWNIDDNHLTKFWTEYCELAKEPDDISEAKKLSLAEIPTEYMPIIADFSLKFHTVDDEFDTYKIDFLLAIVYCYQQVILNNLQISDSKAELVCCVLDTDDRKEDNYVISNFRLQFPYCKTMANIQTRLIRPLVIQKLRTENVISRLLYQPVNDWENIIDPLTVEKPVTMYGSSDKNDRSPLILNYIFPEITLENIETTKVTLVELSDVFFPSNHEHIRSGIVPFSIFSEDIDHDHWLPMFLSLNYYQVKVLPKEQFQNVLKQPSMVNQKSSLSKSYSNSSADILNVATNEPLQTAERFLSMLGRERVESDHFWIDIGKALYTVAEGDEAGLNLWIHFTEQSDAHSGEECKLLYPNFYNNPLTIKTLAWYAKVDSPAEYDIWHREWYLPALERATSCLHSDVADALYRVYWLEFACVSLAKSNLYYFTNHIWKKLDDGHVLRGYISGEFLSLFEKLRTEVSIMIQDSSDSHFKDSAEVMVKKIGNLINKLKMRTYKNNVLLESLEKFHIEEFGNKLDSNPSLMGMVNGIMEATDNNAVVRPGKPEDYVSKSTGLIWRNDLHWKHPLVIRLLDWLTKVFPDKKLLDYFGKLAASCLKGRNSDKLFPIMTGQGDNSKSMIKKLFEAAFGSYCITFPTTLFTSKRTGGGPDPAVARSKYAHVAFAQEPDADDPLKNGTIKEMTGGDRFFARFLNDNGGEIEPMFTLFLMCNTVPIIPHSDKAMKNRTRLIPFLSTWSKKAPKEISDQYKQRLFQMDPFFENQIPELAPAFTWYLTQMYKRYRIEGLKEPSLVTESTTEYWNENDIYLQFINENLEKVFLDGKDEQDPEAKVTIADMYSRFRDWFRECFQGIKCPDRPIVKGELETRMGKTYKRSWKGIKLKVTLAEI